MAENTYIDKYHVGVTSLEECGQKASVQKADKDICIVETPSGRTSEKKDKKICNVDETPMWETCEKRDNDIHIVEETTIGESDVKREKDIRIVDETPMWESGEKRHKEICNVDETHLGETGEIRDKDICIVDETRECGVKREKDKRIVEETPMGKSGWKRDKDICNVNEMPLEESSNMHKCNVDKMLEEESGANAVMNKCNDHETPKEENVDKADIDKCYVGTSMMEEKCEKSDIGKCTDIPLSVSAENVHMDQYNIDETILKRSGEKADIDKFNVAEMPKEENGKDADTYKCNDYDMPQDAVVIETLKSMMTCPDHPETMVTYECEDHKRLLCVTCLAENHRKCNHVSEISNAKKPGNEDTCTRVKETLCQLQERITALKHTSEEHIASLRSQLAVTQSEQQSFFSSMHEKLTQAENKLESQTKMLVNEEMNNLEKTLHKCKNAEAEEIECKKLFEFILRFGHLREKNVIPDLILKRVERVCEIIEEECRKGRKYLKFDGNIDLDTMSNLPNVSIVSECPDEQVKFNIVLGASNDEYKNSRNAITTFPKLFTRNCTSPLSVSTQTDFIPSQFGSLNFPDDKSMLGIQDQDNNLKHIRLMSRNINHHIVYNVRCLDDQRRCNISAIECLPDGRALLIDDCNLKLKVLKKDFSLAYKINLDSFPSDLCHVQDTIYAIAFQDDKSVGIYNIGDTHAYRVRKFQTKFYPVAVASFGNDEYMSVLFEDNEEEKFIQIRDTQGRIERTIYFKDMCDAPFTFEDSEAKRILCKGTDEIFVSTYSEFHCFIDNSDADIGFVYASRFYKSRTYSPPTGISDIAADSEGNIYVCGHDSCNVHQISKDDFRISRILISNIPNPTSLSVNSKEGFIVVGCANDNYLHVHHFI